MNYKTCTDDFVEKYYKALQTPRIVKLKKFEECRGQQLKYYQAVNDNRTEEEKEQHIIKGETIEDYITNKEFGFTHLILNRNKLDTNYPFQYSWDVYDFERCLRIEVKSYQSPTISFTIRGDTIFSPVPGTVHRGPVIDLTSTFKNCKADIIVFVKCEYQGNDEVKVKPTLVMDNNFQLLKEIAQPQKNIDKIAFDKNGNLVSQPHWIGLNTYQVKQLNYEGSGLRLV